MNRKIMGGIIILFGVVMLFAVGYFMFFPNLSLGDIFNFFKKQDAPVQEDPVVTQPPVKPTPITPPNSNNIKRIEADDKQVDPEPVTKNVSREFTKQDLTRMAGSFAERFGSYSNQSSFSNLLDLKMFMSKRMQKWVDNYIAEQRDKGQVSSIYYGITTKAVAQELKEFDEDVGKARVMVKTRRREATISTNNYSNVFSQDIELNFVKENGAWRVDNAFWQTK